MGVVTQGILAMLVILTLLMAWAIIEIRSLRAAVAAGVAFMLIAAVDWVWELPVLPLSFLIIVAVTIGKRARSQAATDRQMNGVA